MTLLHSCTWLIFWLGIISPQYQLGLSLVIHKRPEIAVTQTSWSLFFSHVRDCRGLDSSQFPTLPHVGHGPHPHGQDDRFTLACGQQDGWRKVQRRKGQLELSHMTTFSFAGNWKCNIDSGSQGSSMTKKEWGTDAGDNQQSCHSHCPLQVLSHLLESGVADEMSDDNLVFISL